MEYLISLIRFVAKLGRSAAPKQKLVIRHVSPEDGLELDMLLYQTKQLKYIRYESHHEEMGWEFIVYPRKWSAELLRPYIELYFETREWSYTIFVFPE